MSTFVEMAREGFKFLEGQGFRFRTDESQLPEYANAYFAKGGITVRVYWERRDGVVMTAVGRQRARGLLPDRELGLDFLGDVDRDQEVDRTGQEDERLQLVLAGHAALLRARGQGLLDGDPRVWDDLSRRQAKHWRDFSGGK